MLILSKEKFVAMQRHVRLWGRLNGEDSLELLAAYEAQEAAARRLVEVVRQYICEDQSVPSTALTDKLLALAQTIPTP